ncbi:hypothetical protein Vretimale_4335 [Volvox reticuliferus]|uniref:N-acetyltransferase domain-containing protein n=1 Tax=Volvox reticuliferus TaxID=1737510 RepID=A0A8J4C6E0_9CHLO|nr:hypothetical protein Vretifemale_2943 [Volvox reticuliferus]GIL99089.1 hypothetical protein Vretimale_4335 [Volvox reticuliferus]
MYSFERNFKLKDGTPAAVHILAEVPQYVHDVAHICFNEWPDAYIKDFDIFSVDQCAEDLRKNYMQTDKVPIVLVAHTSAGRFLGTTTLQLRDMPKVRPDLENWLASLVVSPEFRGQQVGNHLIAAVRALAYSLAIQKLYLWTEKSATATWYERHGWRHAGMQDYLGTDVFLMTLEVTSP